MIIKTDDKYYNDIAAAIREKNGTAETYKPSEMALAIANIEGGSENKEILPEGYRQLEYIESTGTQYIDTEYAFTDGFSWEITFEDIAVSNTTLFGGRTSAARTALLYYGNSSNNNGVSYMCCPIAGMNGVATPFKFLDGDPSGKNTVKMTVENNTASVWLNGEKEYEDTAFDGEYISGVTQVIFADNYGTEISEHTSAKVYALKMWQGDTLVRDFIPCRNSSGEVGLYDLVEEKFYSNAGSGSFVEGDEVIIANVAGIPCFLKVETSLGAVVTATLENKSVSATANSKGIATLVLDKEGLWSVTATYEGETKSTEVLIEHNVEEELVFAKTFHIIHNNVQYDYKFLENWTWADFVASEYNDGNFVISGTNVTFFGYKVKANGTLITTSTALEEISYSVSIPFYLFKEGEGILVTVDKKSISTTNKNYIYYDLHNSNYLNILQSFTDYSALYFEGKSGKYTNDDGQTFYNSAGVGYGTTLLTKAAFPQVYQDLPAQRDVVSFDISDLSGNYYVQIGENRTTGEGAYIDYIYNIWLE